MPSGSRALQIPFLTAIPQSIFDTEYLELDLGDNERYIKEKLYELSQILGTKNPEAQWHGALGGEWGYGQEFKNDVFVMHPDCHCETCCTCNLYPHLHDGKEMLPNFRCGDVEIRWYKYIGRDMSINCQVSRKELRRIFHDCRKSIR